MKVSFDTYKTTHRDICDENVKSSVHKNQCNPVYDEGKITPFFQSPRVQFNLNSQFTQII